MLAQLASAFWPSKRSAKNRMIGWSALAFFFCLCALCSQQSALAVFAAPEMLIVFYYLLVWWVRGWLDRRALAWAYQEAENEYVAAPAPAPTTKRTLRLPKKLD